MDRQMGPAKLMGGNSLGPQGIGLCPGTPEVTVGGMRKADAGLARPGGARTTWCDSFEIASKLTKQ